MRVNEYSAARAIFERVMSLPVNPAKVFRLFASLYVVLALSLWLHWSVWQTEPVLFAAIAALPLVAGVASGLMRERWRLELTPDALIHQTLGRREVFAWRRMGPLHLRAAPLAELLLGPTFWFAFPLDGPRSLEERGSVVTGRRLLCVFGDLDARETMAQIEAWRRVHATAGDV